MRSQRKVSPTQRLAGGLAAVMRSKAWDTVRQKVECVTAVRQRAEADDVKGAYTLYRIIDKYLVLTGKDQERFAAEVSKDKEVQTMIDLWEEDMAAYKTEGALEEARKAILLLTRSLKFNATDDLEADLS